MLPAKIRFHVPVLRDNPYSELGLDYAYALAERDAPFRLVSTTPADVGDEDHPWYDLGRYFDTPLMDGWMRVNIACVPPDWYSRAWTENLANIAIVKYPNRDLTTDEIEKLRRYDAVWVQGWTELNRMNKRLVQRCTVRVVDPKHSGKVYAEVMRFV